MKKDIKFSTRMASADREAIKELAKRSGMSMSDYVTACCLGKDVYKRQAFLLSGTLHQAHRPRLA